jgi:lactobin A/cerein 7B family class IIb bacteriocin
MKRQEGILKFEALNESELQNTNGGLYLFYAYAAAVPILLGVALYGAFMNGYNDGRAAASGN